ncbi:MAG: PEGA domain-containing protein [Bradymonadia bacterium]
MRWVCSSKTGAVSLLVLASTLIAAVTQAQNPDVAVLSVGPADNMTAQAVWHLRHEMSTGEKATRFDLNSVLDTGREQSKGSALRSFERGREAFLEFEFEDAIPALMIAFHGLAGHESEHDVVVSTLSLLAQSSGALGRTSERDRAWRLLLRFDPNYQLTDPGIGPRMRASFESARRFMAKRKRTARLSVGRPGKRPVAVFLNGRYLGQAPLSRGGIPSGPHHLRLSSDGYKHVQVVKTLRGGKRTHITPKLSSTARLTLFEAIQSRLPTDIEGAGFTGYMRELKALLNSDQVILVARNGIQLTAALFDLNRERKASVASSRILNGDVQGAALRLLERLYGGLDLLAPTTPQVQSQPILAEKRSPNRVPSWLLWSGAAVGVAAAILIPIALWPDSPDGIESKAGTGAILLRF